VIARFVRRHSTLGQNSWIAIAVRESVLGGVFTSKPLNKIVQIGANGSNSSFKQALILAESVRTDEFAALDKEHDMNKAVAGLSIVLALAATPALGRTKFHRAHPATNHSTYDPSDWRTWPPSKANDIPWAPF
jgi:hypothetical protein